MSTDDQKTEKKNTGQKSETLPGYPIYPSDEDIYSKDREEADIDPENILEVKKIVQKAGKPNEKDFDDDVSGDDLDIPGSNDDDNDFVGNEDEENDYYSLGDDEPEEDEEEYYP